MVLVSYQLLSNWVLLEETNESDFEKEDTTWFHPINSSLRMYSQSLADPNHAYKQMKWIPKKMIIFRIRRQVKKIKEMTWNIELNENNTTLNMPISNVGANSSYVHNIFRFQTYQGVILLLNDNKFMQMINFMLIKHRFRKFRVCLWFMCDTCLSVNNPNAETFSD